MIPKSEGGAGDKAVATVGAGAGAGDGDGDGAEAIAEAGAEAGGGGDNDGREVWQFRTSVIWVSDISTSVGFGVSPMVKILCPLSTNA